MPYLRSLSGHLLESAVWLSLRFDDSPGIAQFVHLKLCVHSLSPGIAQFVHLKLCVHSLTSGFSPDMLVSPLQSPHCLPTTWASVVGGGLRGEGGRVFLSRVLTWFLLIVAKRSEEPVDRS